MGRRVVVHGVLGRMGSEVVKALCADSGLDPVGGVDSRAETDLLPLPDQSRSIPLSTDLAAIINETKPDVVVDFSIAEAALSAVRIAVAQKVNLVLGTTGLSQDNLDEIDRLAAVSYTHLTLPTN